LKQVFIAHVNSQTILVLVLCIVWCNIVTLLFG